MRIAIFHELHSGGARRAVNEFATRLKKKHCVDLYVVDNEENKNEKVFFSNIYFYGFYEKTWKGRDWKIKIYKDSVELFKLYKLHKKIAFEINEKSYDVVFVHPSQYTQAPFILKFLSPKTIYYCEEPLRIAYESEFALDEKMPFAKKTYEQGMRIIRKQIDKKNIRSADIVLANSQFTKKNIQSAYNITSTVCYLGVNIDVFKTIDIKKSSDILYIGARDEVDGFFLFEKAVTFMKIKPKLKIHITGENWLQNESEFIKLYQETKVVVSLARNEPFGLIPLEAMACGIPVVALHEGGYKETLLDKRTGYLVSRNPQHIAEKIEFLLLNEKLRIKLGKAGREHAVKHWTWEKSVVSFEKIIRNLVLK
jgi:glycosyltransferase involved in cell wall biosynthesis